jgi:hypothetical protein
MVSLNSNRNDDRSKQYHFDSNQDVKNYVMSQQPKSQRSNLVPSMNDKYKRLSENEDEAIDQYAFG